MIKPYKTNHSALMIIFISLLMTIFTTMINGQDNGCSQSGSLPGTQYPQGQCDPNTATCCQVGQSYPIYQCSPPVTAQTQAVLTLNSFEEGGDGGGPSACDGQYHDNNTPVVALSTGWFDNKSRCLKDIIIIGGNGQKVRAKVVDQCDSTTGCDKEHGYQVPCGNNIVDGSQAVWNALQADSNSGSMPITWSDA